MATIYYTNHQKPQFIDFLKKYYGLLLCNKPSNVNLKTLHLNRTKGISFLTLNRSSHTDVFCKKGVLGSLQSLFFNKLQAQVSGLQLY